MSSLIPRRALLGGAAASLLVPATARAYTPPRIALPGDLEQAPGATITAIRTPSPVVAMTFDDGPHPRLTPPLLDALKARGIRATFYVIGRNVARHPQLAQRIVAEGHEIGNHTWSHSFLTERSDQAVVRELDSTSAAIFEAVGKVPVTMRPPYGAMHARQRAMVNANRNTPAILWSVDPQDWRRPGANVVANRIVRDAHKGAIILAHDIHPGTIRAMPYALDGLVARGFRFVTVSQMLGWPDWSERRFRLGTA
ncbi:MAG: polysaccharide deacetylase family protein [Pseudomonadota bacterium]